MNAGVTGSDVFFVANACGYISRLTYSIVAREQLLSH